jgi:hypothetical protein
METSTISSCVRFFERMAERVKRMEEEEARLTKESCKAIRAPIFTKTRRSSGFGKGMIRRDKWREGMPRITQAACEVVHEYAQARAAAVNQYVGRKWYSDRAGISTATLNRCANEMMRGEIFLDPTDGVWKVPLCQNEQENETAAAFGEREEPARCSLSSGSQKRA